MKRRKSYHHGNLRKALLEAAIRLVAEVGPAAFTLREAARRAGVSHNAPYRHFQDKEELMAAVAAQGYRELTEAMVKAAEHQSNPLDRLKRAGLAYVRFALHRPEHFTVMFDGSRFTQKSQPAAQEAEQGFATLMNLVKSGQDQGRLSPGDPVRFAQLAWSMIHGIAKLAITGHLRYHTRAEILKFAEFVIDESLPERN